MKYFTIAELCNSVTAVKFCIYNTPGREVTDRLTDLINNILDPLRERYGKPIKVTSGYRSPKLNRV
ncbi:D-Ala-D-Ala carboxypeptidase family metallohydrolase, partial [Salmonella enterica]|uniref:D-Ala-D-Ala carboxypeptidase family metallohydrolase n=1 Tax=Salmonella enterica TaxID=28901 RepID=UPI003CEA5090